MPRRRNAVDGRGRGPAVLPAWPLDPPPPPTPDPAEQPPGHFCRRCGAGGDGPVPPAGWLRLQRRGDGQSDAWRAWQTLALLCSPECLVAYAADLTRQP